MWDGRRVTPDSLKNLNVLLVRDMNIHAQLRKFWNKAFAPEPVKDYQERMMIRAAQLGDVLKTRCDSAPDGVGRADLSKMISYFA